MTLSLLRPLYNYSLIYILVPHHALKLSQTSKKSPTQSIIQYSIQYLSPTCMLFGKQTLYAKMTSYLPYPFRKRTLLEQISAQLSFLPIPFGRRSIPDQIMNFCSDNPVVFLGILAVAWFFLGLRPRHFLNNQYFLILVSLEYLLQYFWSTRYEDHYGILAAAFAFCWFSPRWRYKVYRILRQGYSWPEYYINQVWRTASRMLSGGSSYSSFGGGSSKKYRRR